MILPPDQPPPCSIQSLRKITLKPYPPTGGLPQSHPRSPVWLQKTTFHKEQTHCVVQRIHKALETKQYYSAAFLDISQAFDKVWHTGLLYKLQGPLLYLLYTADLPTSPGTLPATYADDTSLLTTDRDPVVATQLLQTYLLAIQTWLKTWRMKANETKSNHVIFTTRRATCPPVHINDVQLPQSGDVKYLGLHLDRRLTWHKHIFTKRKQLGLTLTKMHWLLGRQYHLSTSNKLLLYKTILKPIWTYGIQHWNPGTIPI
jgi:hypothetical protein